MVKLSGPGEDANHGFTKADTVKSNGNRLSQKEHDPDGPPELEPQGSGYEIIITAALDMDVGGNG